MDLKQATNRRKPSQNRSKERVAVILEAVKALIEEKGIANLKISEIAKRANSSEGSIYQYFSDKETIILSLAEHFMKKIHVIVDKHIDKLDSLDDLDMVMSCNFDDIYALHKNESALRQIWFESVDIKLIHLATVDSEMKADRIYQSVLKFATPKDPVQLKQFILLMSIQFSSVIRLCFSSNVGTPEQLKKIYVDTVVGSITKYIDLN
ncbi:TetR/AcrR family transcriptional regulator [Moritella dasanensis]|uniref:TetR/AcrR family transcriptional regulator n=1 Tax=Moritella dasanensis TaxID=428031 RepID=UPI0003668241|nr:TetR/AcrR family transcriptional regulator [Moritella dasanensis]